MSSVAALDHIGRDASARIVVEHREGRDRFLSLRSDPPLTFRVTESSLTWVGTTAGPIGGDRTLLEVAVLDHASLSVGSVGASIALPGPLGLPSNAFVDVRVGDGGALHWYCEPVIVAADADHTSHTVLRVGDDSDVVWVDEVVLGRHGERPGRFRSTFTIDGPTGPILRTGLDIGSTGWDGPAVLGDEQAVAQVFALGAPAERLLAVGGGLPQRADARHATSTGLAGSATWTAVSSSTAALRSMVREIVEGVAVAPVRHA